jgi:hypothetical protein
MMMSSSGKNSCYWRTNKNNNNNKCRATIENTKKKRTNHDYIVLISERSSGSKGTIDMYTRAHPFHSGKGGTRQHHRGGQRKNVPATKRSARSKEENLLAKARRKNGSDRQTDEKDSRGSSAKKVTHHTLREVVNKRGASKRVSISLLSSL